MDNTDITEAFDVLNRLSERNVDENLIDNLNGQLIEMEDGYAPGKTIDDVQAWAVSYIPEEGKTTWTLGEFATRILYDEEDAVASREVSRLIMDMPGLSLDSDYKIVLYQRDSFFHWAVIQSIPRVDGP